MKMNSKLITGKYINMQKLSKTILNSEWVKKREISFKNLKISGTKQKHNEIKPPGHTKNSF